MPHISALVLRPVTRRSTTLSHSLAVLLIVAADTADRGCTASRVQQKHSHSMPQCVVSCDTRHCWLRFAGCWDGVGRSVTHLCVTHMRHMQAATAVTAGSMHAVVCHRVVLSTVCTVRHILCVHSVGDHRQVVKQAVSSVGGLCCAEHLAPAQKSHSCAQPGFCGRISSCSGGQACRTSCLY